MLFLFIINIEIIRRFWDSVDIWQLMVKMLAAQLSWSSEHELFADVGTPYAIVKFSVGIRVVAKSAGCENLILDLRMPFTLRTVA
jgi:hypothetical protein